MHFRADTLSTTSIAISHPYVYTVSKDMTLIKWELAPPRPPSSTAQTPKKSAKKPPQIRRKPKKVVYVRGNKNNTGDSAYLGHTDQILTVAASADGKFVVTGGRDRRLIVWNAVDLKPLRVFTQHRDAVMGLAFRRGTNQLYSSAKDRTIKTWSLDELAYVETLFGHQDEVVDVAALAQERCVTVGARDRTARLWKVVDETQLVFRGGGGGSKTLDNEKKAKFKQSENGKSVTRGGAYAEGSIDRVALIDEDTFVTGSDNGNICLWNIHKKKPVFTVALAHGLDPPLPLDESFAERELAPDTKAPSPPQPRWITALATVPYSDLVLSGSWDGFVRAWRVSPDRRRIEAVGVVGAIHNSAGSENPTSDTMTNGLNGHMDVEMNGENKPQSNRESMRDDRKAAGDEAKPLIKGIINDLAVFDRSERNTNVLSQEDLLKPAGSKKAKRRKGKVGAVGSGEGVCIVAAVGSEHRLGRWKKVKGARNGAVVFEVPRKVLAQGDEVEAGVNGTADREEISGGKDGVERSML